jgi:hypothetical protein
MIPSSPENQIVEQTLCIYPSLPTLPRVSLPAPQIASTKSHYYLIILFVKWLLRSLGGRDLLLHFFTKEAVIFHVSIKV